MDEKLTENQSAENGKEHQEDKGQSRRKALKKIAVGGTVAVGASTLPPRWGKPIINKVLVPAHAQTSPVPTTTVAPTTTPGSAPTPPPQETTTTTTTTTTTLEPCVFDLECNFYRDINYAAIEPDDQPNFLWAQIQASVECPPGVDPESFDGAEVKLTVTSYALGNGCINPAVIPGPSTWQLDSNGFVKVQMSCTHEPFPESIDIKVEFVDKATFGDAETTCSHDTPA